jgi:hypothetical protein
VQEGLYKVDFHTVHGTGTGVIYAIDGKLRGGNSAFTFRGNYNRRGDRISVKVSTERYNDDPAFKALFGNDMITLLLEGESEGSVVTLAGSALQLPGVTFTAVLTHIDD